MSRICNAEWKIFLLIAVISSAVYANSFQNSFHFDDQHFIVENTYIRDLKNIPSFFISPRYSSFEQIFTSHYRPLLVTSYAINYALGGLRPGGYHAVNLLFHIGSAFLLYLIISAVLGGREEDRSKKLEVRSKTKSNILPLTSNFYIALSASLIFAVHPFNSEVVNYITARSSVMCAFFYLLSFYFWIRFRRGKVDVKSEMLEVRRKKLEVRGEKLEVGSEKILDRSKNKSYFLLLTSNFYLFSLLAFLLAMLTKEIAITLPVILFLYDFFFHRQQDGKSRHNASSSSRCLPHLPYIILIIVPYLLYRISVYGSITGGGTRDYLANFLTQPKVLLKYIQLMFLPAGHTIEHDIRLSASMADITVILSIASVLILLIMAYLLFRMGREWRMLSLFILWFFITLLPTTIIPLNAELQENRAYLAGVMSAVIAGWALTRLKRRYIFPGLALLVIALSVLTFNRNFAWKDDLTLWSDAVAKSPMSARVHDNLGLAWMGVKKYDLAIGEFNKTLKLNPRYYLAYYNAGVAYQLQGDLEKARFAYEESLKINPSYFRSHYNAGIVYKNLGEPDMAISSYDRAIALDPRHPFVYNNLGVVLTEKGDYRRAEDVFKMAVAINPGYEKAYYNLGNVYFRKKEYGKAAEAYSAAVRIRPDYEEADKMLKQAISMQ